MKEPLESPLMRDFVDNLDRINALAEQAPGYVWRLQTDEGDATALRPFGENYLVNLSVWKDVAALREYVYKSDHASIMRRRGEWFDHMAEAFSVLWWIPENRFPGLEEARERLEHLRQHGPTPEAFTFRNAFPAPE